MKEHITIETRRKLENKTEWSALGSSRFYSPKERDWYHQTFWMIPIYFDMTPRHWMNRCQRCDLILRVRNDQDTGHRCKKPKTRKGNGTCKVKFTLQLTMKAQRGVDGQRHVRATLPPVKRPATHVIGDWVGPRAGLDGSGKSRSHQDLIPGPSSP